METRTPLQPSGPSSQHFFIPSLFLAFRLVYIPLSTLSHTGHGLPWLNTAAVLAATFGMEYLTRRSVPPTEHPASERELWFVVIALLLLGLFPEEAPIGGILWAGIGAVWGRVTPSVAWRLNWRLNWRGLLAGGLLGATGLFGPGSWLMAALLLVWGWRGRGGQLGL